MRFSGSISISLLFSLLAVIVTGCVYDFSPQVEGGSSFVAIEGDILIGEVCTFSARLSTGLDKEVDEGVPISCRFRVEADDGTSYDDEDGKIDLTAADPSLDYRLVAEVTAPFHRTYVSEWDKVLATPPIDSLSYTFSEDRMTLWVNVATHSEGDPGYYRWTASETWEYHATYYSPFFFAPKGTEYKGLIAENDTVFEYMDGENTYYCWTDGERSDVLIASTVGLSEDRLVDHRLYSFSDKDKKVSHVYFVEMTQIRISERAYQYWETLSKNSSDVGGLFSPEPTEVRGNISCMENPDELVLGFISVATCSREEMFISNYQTHFSHWRGPTFEPEFPFPQDWWKFNTWGYMIAWFDEGWGTYAWLPGICVDCRLSGGTKERPSWWINNDK